MESATKKILFYGTLLFSSGFIGVTSIFGNSNNDNQIIKCCVNCGGTCRNNNEIAMCCYNCTMPIISQNNTAVGIINKQTNEMGWKREQYVYYLQDMALERVILSKIFNRLAPGSFPDIKFNIYYDGVNKQHILETKSRDMNFISMADYGYENGRIEGESYSDFESRVRNIEKMIDTNLNGIEELYAITTYLGMPTQSWNSWDVGFSRDTWQAMMVYNDTFHPTFSELEEKNLEIDSISEPFEYKFDKNKYCLALQKVEQFDDEEIEKLVDEAFGEASSQHGFSYFKSRDDERYKGVVKELLKKNKKTVIKFLNKKTECLASDKK
ncbi:hypothetical protein GAMM_30005 [Gammaproteobacteria bacterium]